MEIEGLVRVAEILAGTSEDELGTVVVFDGDNEPGEAQSASVEVDTPSIEVVDGVVRLTVTASFGAEQANFDWRVREVRTVEGIVLDRMVEDQGRKAPGTVWTTVAEMDLIPS